MFDSIRRDPLTLLTIAATSLWAVVENPRGARPVALGALLYVGAVVYAGGDFMSGRMFAAPPAACVVLLAVTDAAALFPYRWLPAAIALVLGFNGVRAVASTEPPPGDVLTANGVSDERWYYFAGSGLINYSRTAPFWPNSKWIENGLQAAAAGGPASVTAEAAAQAACTWSAQTADPWIHLAEAVNGNGTGTINFNVEQNRSSVTRSGVIHVAWNGGDTNFVVKQTGLPACSFALSPAVLETSAAEKDLSATVTPSDPSCEWKADFDGAAWLSFVSGGANTGQGTIVFHVRSNATDGPRSATLVVTGAASGRATATIHQVS